MTEPIKVNAYWFVASFSAGNECWWVLRDDKTALIVRPEDTILMQDKERLYSIIKPKRIEATSISKEAAHLIMMHPSGNVTVIKRKLEKDDNNKKNATKI